MQLKDTSALVCGGAGGFGEATVRRLVNAGAHVLIADLAEDKGRALEAELGSRVRFVSTDVTSEDSVQAAVDAAGEVAPLRSTVIVHGGPAAARRIVSRSGTIIPLDTFRRTVDIFLTGTFNVMSRAAAAMIASDPVDSDQRGVIISTASIAGFEGQVGQSDYSAAKGGVIGLTLTAARDLAPMGVRIMCIAPGTFFTPAFQMAEDEAQARYGATVPNPKRMGHVDEYAHLAQNIIENDYLNGTVIRIDGALRFNI
ncbi:SDR family NAD(P)-dependent oxidoreductase [Rhodococcus sp. BP-149]|uniref:SDR family NAD(P)-dependent oxidoreductase n=1 Tax=unclassified Rhodococcus (in: high G+C Gram-positive bacteria) TaxID=192944 RepID=UPI001C9B023B|nr:MULTISPECIES: SDR family NAD(P)-dependent oxidoreductase [unclassified Rhodococcus (in: high G+C Gram-positive bacteria)]MBY6687792.1 SDR family NAD(P)-dependent oxidoreductase [Rhodococcus sp. BP-288]MBY6696057.1 SDR family NAD(P)-dependent oxidoreductase [Rhodococcus sp. BP-188]MBY6700654.1 SDR family NAD(P)-dependent oxidoreductase [Rhodococcus sp. BP-285]MBY6705051.1 SDR family NAD(P)-dependent oxidoreductase [Rhodococcus sp. BP-283]MBY6713779.1 SDR family NAD(P)-dependent oxidoreductas